MNEHVIPNEILSRVVASLVLAGLADSISKTRDQAHNLDYFAEAGKTMQVFPRLKGGTVHWEAGDPSNADLGEL